MITSYGDNRSDNSSVSISIFRPGFWMVNSYACFTMASNTELDFSSLTSPDFSAGFLRDMALSDEDLHLFKAPRTHMVSQNSNVTTLGEIHSGQHHADEGTKLKEWLVKRNHSRTTRRRHRGPRPRRAATARTERIWDHGIIPYEIDKNFTGKISMSK